MALVQENLGDADLKSKKHKKGKKHVKVRSGAGYDYM
jgi:large subunit GTPase 1